MKKDQSRTPSDELPGMLAVAKGVAEQRWPHTMDAKKWADEFATVKRENITYDLMLSWFANAIMAGYDTARQRAVPFCPNCHCSTCRPECHGLTAKQMEPI